MTSSTNATGFSNELRELIDAACDDQLTPESAARLEQFLLGDPAARQYYLRCLSAQALLERFDAAGFDGETESESGSRTLPANIFAPLTRAAQATYRFFAQPTPLSMSVALLAVVSMLGVLALIAAPYYQGQVATTPSNHADVEFVAEITGMTNARWADARGEGETATHLQAGQELRLESGLVEIQFDRGAVVVLQGPAQCRLTGENGLRLHVGSLAARVPKQAVGFLVGTEAATFTDLGTQFLVAVAPSQTATMFVQQGSVTYQCASAAEPVVRTAGQGVEISAEGVVRNVAPDPTAFAALRRGVVRQTLVHNGRFEEFGDRIEVPTKPDADSSGWVNRGTQQVLIVRSPSRSGQFHLQFTGQPTAGGEIQQQFATVPGTQYAVTFRVTRNTGKNAPTMNVEVRDAGAVGTPGSSRVLAHKSILIDWDDFQWRSMVIPFVAESEQTTIRFFEPRSSKSRNVGPLLDDVRVAPTPTLMEPEDFE